MHVLRPRLDLDEGNLMVRKGRPSKRQDEKGTPEKGVRRDDEEAVVTEQMARTSVTPLAKRAVDIVIGKSGRLLSLCTREGLVDKARDRLDNGTYSLRTGGVFRLAGDIYAEMGAAEAGADGMDVDDEASSEGGGAAARTPWASAVGEEGRESRAADQRRRRDDGIPVSQLGEGTNESSPEASEAEEASEEGSDEEVEGQEEEKGGDSWTSCTQIEVCDVQTAASRLAQPRPVRRQGCGQVQEAARALCQGVR